MKLTAEWVNPSKIIGQPSQPFSIDISSGSTITLVETIIQASVNNILPVGGNVTLTPQDLGAVLDYQLGENLPLSNTDTIPEMLGKLEAQINAVLGGGGSSVEWLDLQASRPTEMEVCDTDGSKRLQVANINGLVYVRGMIRGINTSNWYSNSDLAVLPSTCQVHQYDPNYSTDVKVTPSTLNLLSNGTVLRVNILNFGTGNKVMVYGILGVALNAYP